MPDTAPRWARVTYALAPVVVAAGLAAIGSWIAFGAGERHFSMAGMIGGPVGEGTGRVVFGLGALVTWLLVLALARACAKQIFGRKG
jgi:hypothetical protein